MPDRRAVLAIEYCDDVRVVKFLTSSPELVRATVQHLKTPLHVAVGHNREAISRRWLEAGADVQAETSWAMTPLQWAANMGSTRAGRLLIEQGAAVNLWSAAGLGLPDRLDAFWDAAGHRVPGAGQEGYRQTATGEYVAEPPRSSALATVSDAFCVACRNGHAAVARFLLPSGARTI